MARLTNDQLVELFNAKFPGSKIAHLGRGRFAEVVCGRTKDTWRFFRSDITDILSYHKLI